VGRKELSNWVP